MFRSGTGDGMTGRRDDGLGFISLTGGDGMQGQIEREYCRFINVID